MSLSLMMRSNWEGLSMASPQMQSYKPERPVYSTPHPVQSTPANNECKLVELRGAEVASFIIAGEEYICLPQAFDLFLKHLVGGLHTVYTKLKRLNITPVVCNVEQVRVLRGLGAIQPGVNRCKLITRKDFETLYQDCTTASRPGRPPKRYPILPPSDLMSHPGARSMNPPRGLLGSPDFANFHKRMRLDHDAGYHQQARRMSSSPTRSSPPTARKYSSGADELYANAANIYLQQALRQQYQQFIANGLHNGMSSQHAPMNAALAPLIGMSNPNLFNGSIPPNLLNHINEYARNNARDGLNANINREGAGGENLSPRQENTESADKQLESPRARYNSMSYENAERNNKTPSQGDRSTRSPQNGLDGRKSSDRPPCTTPNSLNGRRSVGNGSVSSFDSGNKSLGDQDYSRTPRSPNDGEDFPSAHMSHNSKYEEPKDNQIKVESLESDNHGDEWRAPPGPSNISSMQTLLSNIQGLLKVAADNAKLQDKQLSFEIAELKNRICKEQELRGLAERKLEESERIRASIQRKLKREREAVKRLQEQKLSAHEKLPETGKEKTSDDVDVTSSPSEAGSPASNCDVHSSHNLQVDTNAAEQGSTTPTPTSDFSPTASSPSSVNDCAPYWSGRSLASDINSHRNQSPERTSPVNMTSGERNWMACNLVQSSSCAK